MYKKVEECRICGNRDLRLVLDLGEQVLTGVFPCSRSETTTSGPLQLVKCFGNELDVCGLLQLGHSYEANELYGDNYGYRSGLNQSMVAHLNNKVKKIVNQIEISQGSLIIDIGSNDGTTLRAYGETGATLVGIDPTVAKFEIYYPANVRLISDFFSVTKFQEIFGSRKAMIVTSFSMFYDLDDPLNFMRGIFDILDDKGIWVFEQSYMPKMLEMNSYDTVCHEHLEYYSLKQIKWMTDRAGFVIVDVEFNETNGGSFSVTVKKKASLCRESPTVSKIIKNEQRLGLDTLNLYNDFALRVAESRTALRSWIDSVNGNKKSVIGLGASTKGNVLLQYCGLMEEDITCIGEINEEKVGRFTPGSFIPIISETEAIDKNPDYLLILPWHFRKEFLKNPKFAGSTLAFPLPTLRIEKSPGLKTPKQ